MIANLQPYPEYKESGVAWLGGIPDHWEVRRVKQLFHIANGATPQSGRADFWDGGIPWVTPADMGRLKSSTIERTARTVSKAGYQTCATTLVPAGSIILSTRAPIGHVALAGVPLCMNQGCRGLTLRGPNNSSYFYYLLVTGRQELQAQGAGTTFQELDRSALGSVFLPVPQIPEQAAIVRFLDWANGRLERAIRAKRKVVALLHEQKQAIIHRAVTRGLDPTVPLKPSGIPWLGEIPEHWEVRAVGQLFYLGRGRVISNQEIGDNSGPYPVFSSQTENEGVMGHINSYMFNGDYLTWTTDGAKAGTVFVRSGAFNCTNVCGTLKARVQLSLSFIRHALNQGTSYYVRLDINPKLMNNVMARIRVPFPEFSEQATVAEFVDAKTISLDKMAASLHREIELLREYRTRLVADVVTGKVDVREAARELPEEAEEPERLEEEDAGEEAVSQEEDVSEEDDGAE